MVSVDSVVRCLPRARNFCWCLSLKTGCLLIGWIHVITGLILEYFALHEIIGIECERRQEGRVRSHYYDPWDEYETADHRRQNLFTVGVIQGGLVLMISVHTLASILLIIGVAQKSRNKMRFWLITQITIAVALVLEIAAMFLSHDRNDGHEFDIDFHRRTPVLIMQLMAFGAIYGISIYGIFIVKGYHEETMEAERRNPGILLK